MGLVCQAQAEYTIAVTYHEKSLNIARQINDKRGEADQLTYIGDAYVALHETGKAKEYYRRAKALYDNLRVNYRLVELEKKLSRLEG